MNSSLQNPSFEAAKADLRRAFEAGSSLEEAATVFRHHFGKVETAAIRCDFAEHEKKDAAMLRAPLWEDKTS